VSEQVEPGGALTDRALVDLLIQWVVTDADQVYLWAQRVEGAVLTPDVARLRAAVLGRMERRADAGGGEV